MFITRPHFGLCLSPLTVYHYHIRPPPSLCSTSENSNPGIKHATYVKTQLFIFWVLR